MVGKGWGQEGRWGLEFSVELFEGEIVRDL